MVEVVPAAMSKIRPAELPLIVSLAAPGPLIATLTSTVNGPLASTIVWPAS
jgi:hypothetical protein